MLSTDMHLRTKRTRFHSSAYPHSNFYASRDLFTGPHSRMDGPRALSRVREVQRES
jgi:hypothetical protein